ncbi:MAG TPA: FAD binding domain-containing protein [candidate division Zixibacteria bacterium]|nr:FAD binding domain-containing protein [candidate division Zixibacteria bacterium]
MTVSEYFLPESLDEALSLVDKHRSELLVMGGGTVVMPLINGGISLPKRVLGLRHAGLDYVNQSNGYVTIGAAVPLTQMLELDAIPMLQEAARNTAAWSIRNLGTVGGNLFVPPPAGDFAVALLALDAWLKLASKSGERIVALSEFYTGFLSNILKDDELVVEIQVPLPEGETVYIKYGRKRSNTPSIVTVAIQISRDGRQVERARIALNGVGPHPKRAVKAESVLTGSILDSTTIQKAADQAMEECEPFSDAISSEWYRRRMVGVYVKRALSKLIGEEE